MDTQITLLLQRASRGDATASNELYTQVYSELRRLAGGFIRRERHGHTLQPTALVHETYLRMLGGLAHDWSSRAHFFAVAAKVMRRILVDYARSRATAKRSGASISDLDRTLAISENKIDLILSIDSELERLERLDARQAKIVEMRFFAGLTEEEIGLILDASSRTIKRDWKMAKAWLRADFDSRPSSAV